MRKFIILFMIIFTYVPQLVKAQQLSSTKVDVDLVDGKFYDVPFLELTGDKVKELAGQPEKTEIFEENKGFRLYYFTKGFWISFVPCDNNKSVLRMGEIYIFLKDETDKALSKTYSAFKGSISRNISAKWTKEKIFRVFPDLRPQDLYKEDLVAKAKTIFGEKKDELKALLSLLCRVRIILEKYHFSVYYDDSTTLLEKILITVFDPDDKLKLVF